MAVNFQHLLSKPMDTVKRPVAKPAGTYFGQITGHKFDESRQKKTPFVRFMLGGVQAGPDIDQAQLVNPEDGSPIDLTKWTPHVDYYLTEDSLYRLKDFLESLKISTEGRAFGEAIPETKGMPVQFTVTMEPAQGEGGGFYNNVASIAGVEA